MKKSLIVKPLVSMVASGILFAPGLFTAVAAPAVESAGQVADKVDWASFLNRHDLVFAVMPTRFENGAFLGNGTMGAMIYRKEPGALCWGMGSSAVTERRRDNARLPIGDLVLKLAGNIQKADMRLDLWNAEVRGTVTTDKGSVQFRSWIHAAKMLMEIDIEATGEETAAAFAWSPGTAQMHPELAAWCKETPNPPGTSEVTDGVEVFTQKRHAGGEFATAWKDVKTDKGRRVLLSIADSFPGNTAHQEAAEIVREASAGSSGVLVASHQAWWHALYRKSFVSIPDTRLESFYWIQIYKLACTSRPESEPVDLPGVWYLDAKYSRIWWNLNIQTLYLPVYTANQLELGESLVRLFDDHRSNFVEQAKNLWGCDDGASVSHTTDNKGRRGDGALSPPSYLSPGDFGWALHDYYLHYRYSMDHSIITNQTRHAFYPLLRGSVNVYLKMLKKGDDGKLHLPVLYSPEYGRDEDTNYNLSVLCWSLETLIALNQRYALNDPLLPRWCETLANLTPYPVDETGLRIGAKMALTTRHRHWSHILMVHPLHSASMDLDVPANWDLINRSVRHWMLGVDDPHRQSEVNAWSRLGAASLYAALGDGGNANDNLQRHLADRRAVRPNTMYIEGSPVIECSIVAARAVQDMLLQSHNDLLRIFPATPTAWPSAVFHNFLAEGAFLVSAERQGGQTLWVRIKSLAGEPCRVSARFGGDPVASVPLKVIGRNRYELTLARGEEAVMHLPGKAPVMVIKPLPGEPALYNYWGAR